MARLRSRALTALGMLFMWPLLRTQATGTLLVAASPIIPWAQDCYLLFLIVGALFVAVTLAARDFLPHLFKLRWPVTAVATTTALVNLGLVSAIYSGTAHPILLVVSVLFFGVCVPLLLVAWAFALVSLFKDDFRASGLCLAASFAGSFLLGFLQYLPSPFPYAFPVLCPLVTGWCWHFLSSSEGQQMSGCNRLSISTMLQSLPLGSFAALVVAMFLSCFLIGVARSGSIAILEDIGLYYAKDLATVAVTIVIVFLLYTLLSKRRSLRVILVLILTLLCVGQLIILAFDGDALALVGIGVSSAARASLSFLLYLYLLILVCGKNLPVVPAFVSVFVSTNLISDALSFVAVPAVSAALGADYAELIKPLSMGIGMAALLCLALFSGPMTLDRPRLEEGDDRVADSPTQLECQVDELACRFGVSDREREVMLCIVSGYSYKATAAELGITEGTVQSHIKRLYTKIDVHSRQELIDTVRAIEF